MTSVHPRRPPRSAGWRAAVRCRARLLFAVSMLVAMAVIAVAAGWEGSLAAHSRRAWQWVVMHWLASSALGVFVAMVSVVVAATMPRWQQHRAEQVAAAEHVHQQHKQEQYDAREREEAAAVEQAAWARRCRELLALWPLPRIEEVNPYDIGVFYSRRADAYRGEQPRPPYVPRSADKTLVGLLRSQPLVLVKGRSRAGKSRTAFEVAAGELAGWRLLVPKDRGALTRLGGLERLPGEGDRVLVWLDDLDEYLAVEDADGLDAGLLGRWAACRPPVKVVATIRLEEYGRLAATPGELGRAVRALLNRFDPGALALPVGFEDADERAAIGVLYAGEQVTGGLAEHLAAAHELVDRLEVGEASVPEGAGLVLAAVDCRRAGLDRPVSRADLAGLLPLYLRRLRPLVGLREGDVDRGFGWATEPVGRTAALLVADPDSLAGTFRVADPIIDYVERRDGRRLIDPAVWDHLLSRVSPKEATKIAFAAYTRGELGPAETALRQVIDSGHPNHAPAAMRNLGRLLAERRDVAGARVAYQQVIDSRHPEQAPAAMRDLGHLLERRQNVAGAQAAYQRVVDSRDPEQAPAAMRDLGRLLAEQGDVAGAQAAYQRAIDSRHPDQAAVAMRDLGRLLAGQGDVAGARVAYQRAIDSGHPNEAAVAMRDLGRLLERRGDVADAHAAHQQAIDSG